MDTAKLLSILSTVETDASAFWAKVGPFAPTFAATLPDGETKTVITTAINGINQLATHHDVAGTDGTAGRLSAGLDAVAQFVKPLLPSSLGPLWALGAALEPLLAAGVAELASLGKTPLGEVIVDPPVDEKAPV